MTIKSRYSEIADELSKKIIRGDYIPGERFHSRSELCSVYHVSGLTAVRVQNLLADRGLLKKVRGNGVYVNYSKNSNMPACEITGSKKVKRIIIFRSSYELKESRNYTLPILFAAEAAALRSGMNYMVSVYNYTDISLNDINIIDIDKDAGYLILAGGPYPLFNAAVILMNPAIHSVLVDTFIPGSHCVLTDSFDGMEKIVDYAVESGCRNFIFCGRAPEESAELYNAERRDAAVYHAKRHGFKCQVMDTRYYAEIMKTAAESNLKTAVMFPHDDPALRFKKLINASKKHADILVTGFDGFAQTESGLENLTTVQTDLEALGTSAVSILAEPNTECKKILRIQGKLIVKD